MSARYGTFVPDSTPDTDDYAPRTSSEITLVDASASAIHLENVSLLKQRGKGGEGVTPRARKVEMALSYCIFFVLGSCTLLAWNSEIVAGSYFRARLEGSELQSSFSSYVALTFTVANLVFLFIANYTQHGKNLANRISYSVILMAVMLAVLVLSTQIDGINPELFFVLLILTTIILAYSASYLQNGVVGLASRYGHQYLQGAMSGQGAVEVVVATVQFVSAYTSEDPVEVPGLVAAPVVPRGIMRSALLFFSAVTLFSVVAYLLHMVLIRLALYRMVLADASSINSASSDSLATIAEDDKMEGQRPSLPQVERKVRTLGLAVLYVFSVTISVFPSITSTILSVHDPAQGRTGGLGATLSTPELFVSIGFVVFAVGDWMGRMIPGVKALKIESHRVLVLASLARTAFIPLFLLCNVAPSSAGGEPFFNSDLIFLVIMVFFGLTNGYLSTLIMLAGVADSSLESHEVEAAATCLSMYLTAGLAVGSFLSFFVRAAMCQCNPFL